MSQPTCRIALLQTVCPTPADADAETLCGLARASILASVQRAIERRARVVLCPELSGAPYFALAGGVKRVQEWRRAAAAPLAAHPLVNELAIVAKENAVVIVVSVCSCCKDERC